MGNIILLDENTINKIAAGEVVDRPASIVKELVENSIDAKASAITIEIKNGGIKYIKVQDNGIGFASDDVELAFERHATSKIRKEEDLITVKSMGFRGEALASIASIARVSLISKNKNEDVGTKAYVEAGEIKYITNEASIQGTKIEIFDVFHNVPARFKFLKKDSTEAGYIEDVIIRMALANPQITFKYINNSKTIIQTSGKSDLKSTIYDIFGKEIYNNIIPVFYKYNNIEIKGVIGRPNISRSTRMHQFTYVNSRYIKDKIINSAIDKACSEKFAINKFPFCVLNLIINPKHIDVNVHPAKLEVKFDDENLIFNAVYHGVRQAIEDSNKADSPFTNIKVLEQKAMDEITSDLKNTGIIKDSPTYKKFSFNIPAETHNPKDDLENKVLDNIQQTTETINQEETSLLSKSKDELTIQENSQIKYSNDENIQENIIKEEVIYKYIGQVFDTYIIIQINNKMYIIDQHAAHERLLFEQFKGNYYSTDRNTQMLLIPTLVELTPKEKNIVLENIEMFEKAGFILEEFGENTIKISGVPNIGYDIEYNDMFRDIIDEIQGALKTDKIEKEHRFIATLACKAAVKGNMKLNEKEQIELIDEMVNLENPFTCPHGRPTAYEISKYEIERKFLRK